jgi:release factor glutamine methyltransferase
MQRDWNIKNILEWTTRYFADRGIQEPRLEADLLLAHALQKDRVFLYANYDIPLNREERDKYKQLIIRRVKQEPLAYITGQKEFMSLLFKVNPHVLIPRPETELLVETALELAQTNSCPRIIDVGTGSGCIAISLAFYLPEAEVVGIDISAPALAVARENALTHGVEVEFREGNLLQNCAGEEKYDLIVANLPYVADGDCARLEAGVKDYEPRQALAAGEDGMDLYRALVPQSYELLKCGGYLLFEFSPEQAEIAWQLTSGFKQVKIHKDLTGKNRLLQARKE